jgi:hypothetical protein
MKAWLKLPMKWQNTGDLISTKSKEQHGMSRAIPDHSYGWDVNMLLNLMQILNLQVKNGHSIWVSTKKVLGNHKNNGCEPMHIVCYMQLSSSEI